MKLHALLISSAVSGILGFSAISSAQEAAPAPAAPTAEAAAPAPAPVPAAEAPAPQAEAAPAPAAPAAEAAAPAPEAAPAAEAAPKKAPRKWKMRGMLPMGFRDFVTGEQKEQIYGIQQKYRPRMEELEKQMQALREEMDKEIRGILTPEQLEKVKAREAEMRTKRAVRP